MSLAKDLGLVAALLITGAVVGIPIGKNLQKQGQQSIPHINIAGEEYAGQIFFSSNGWQTIQEYGVCESAHTYQMRMADTFADMSLPQMRIPFNDAFIDYRVDKLKRAFRELMPQIPHYDDSPFNSQKSINSLEVLRVSYPASTNIKFRL